MRSGPKLLLILLITCIATQHTQGYFYYQPRRPEQTKFHAEGKIKHPVAIPADVLRTLQADEENQTCLTQDEAAKDMPASWFSASPIELNSDGLQDLIVTVVNPCLYGANINPFWIFRKTRGGHRLVLRLNTLGLDVLDTRRNGYRDIRTSTATSNEIFTTVFSFQRDKYRARRHWRRRIGHL
jgi:hypothetical protein